MFVRSLLPVRAWIGAFFVFPIFSGGVVADTGLAEPYELAQKVVVTATRSAEPVDAVLDSVSIITREDIERSAADDLLELLRLVPGVDIVRSGPIGAQTSIFLRGSNSNHVLVLIDGIRASSTNTGAYAWELLPVNQIERIEIVRGPKGSVYGSDAIGGVIQVFTRSRPEPYARAAAGSWNTRGFEGGWGAERGDARISVNGAIRASDGFSAQNPDGYAYDPDDDGADVANLGINAAYGSGNGVTRFSLLYTDTESEFDVGVSAAEQALISLRYAGSFASFWSHELFAGYVSDQLDSDYGGFTTGFESRRVDLGWQHQVALASGLLRFGLEHARDAGEDPFAFDERRDNTGVHAGYEQSWERWLFEAAGRYDHNSEFGGQATGQIGLGFDLSEAWRIGASWGSAFRGPNLNEQFSPGFGGLFAGNPDLRPEDSRSAEASLRWQGEHARFRVSVYDTEVDDMISFSGPGFQAINLARAELQGVEFDSALDRGPWRVTASATLQSAEDESTGAALLRRPDRKGALTLDRRLGESALLGLEWFVSGSREDFGGITLGSYALLNLHAGWGFARAWRLELRAENVLDEDYAPAFGFNGAGRSAFLSLAWQP